MIIVTKGAKEYWQSCLNSVKEQAYSNLELIVINNSSDNAFESKLREYSSSIKLYSAGRNLFYAAALNKGIELSRGEFVLCLNDDLVLEKGFIAAALKGFLVNDNIGMASGKILRPDSLTLDSTGLFLSIWRTARERGYGKIDQGQFEKEGFVFGASGAAAFYRKKMLEEIKEGEDYFDGRFGMFYEDLDLAWRGQRRGWRAYYLPQAKALHTRGGSFRPDSGLGKGMARQYLNDELHCDLIKNRYLTIFKNETIFGLILHIIPILLYDLCVWGYVFIFRPGVFRIFFAAVRNTKP